MEVIVENQEQNEKRKKDHVETNYEAHKDNPAPAPTVNEPDTEGAGQAMKWIIPIVVIILLAIWFLFFRNTATK